MSKSDELLAVLDMPEEKEQRKTLADLGYKEILYSCASLADLAFRLRDEAYDIRPEGWAWHEGKEAVRQHLGMNERWFDNIAQPIHWIIAALIAKELAGKELTDGN